MIQASRVFLFIVTISGAIGLVWCVSESRRPRKQILPAAIIGFSVSLVAALLSSIYIQDIRVYYSVIATVSLAALIAVMAYYTKDPWYKIAFELVTQANAFLIIMFVGKSFSVMFGGNEWADAGARALSYLATYLVYKFYLKKKFRTFVNSYNLIYGWIGLTLVSLAFTILFLSIQYFPVVLALRTDVKLFTNVMICAIVTYGVTYIALVAIFTRIVEWQKAKSEMREAEMKTEYWKSQIEAQEVLINNTRKIKHDMRHHDTLLVEFLNNKQYDKALNYLQEHGAIIDSMTIKQYCKNYTVNCLLSSYIQRAEKAGIKVECHADIPDELNIDDLKLASLYANLIENAIEACERIKDETITKFINIHTAFENGTLRILIENSANNDVKFDGPFPISQKANPSGIGTKNIYELAQQYGGLCDYSLANGIFTARLILVVK